MPNFKLDVYLKAPFMSQEKKILEKMHFRVADFKKCDTELEKTSNKRWLKDDLIVVFRSEFFVKGDEKNVIQILNQIYCEGVYNISGRLQEVEVL